jgi:cold shock CspA family protein
VPTGRVISVGKFGFVKMDKSEDEAARREVFISGSLLADLKVGDRISFDLNAGAMRGPRAFNVKRLTSTVTDRRNEEYDLALAQNEQQDRSKH